MNHKGLTFVTAASAAVTLLAGCDSTTGGNPKSGVPTAGTSTTSSGAASPGATATSPRAVPVNPSPKGVVTPPGAHALSPQNGYVFIATKSGKTRCQVNTTQVGCESDFANAPQVDEAHGVRVTHDGKLSWVLGNLGDIPAVTIDYQTYSAMGWIISATADGTRFTNQSSGHGMFISTSGAQVF